MVKDCAIVTLILLSLTSCNARENKLNLACQSQSAGVGSILMMIDPTASHVHVELNIGNGCVQTLDAIDGAHKPLTQLVNCSNVMSQEPDDQVMKIDSDQIVFGNKNNPNRLDRSTGMWRGANGAVFAICAPVNSEKKF